MATEHVKVFEEKKSLPLWAWLFPLLVLLALLLWYFLGHRTATDTSNTPAVATSSAPSLAAVHFATDSAQLTPEAQGTLNTAATYMKANPSAHLRVEGYTDAAGSDQTNQTLSQQRAYSVANYLKSQGVEGSRLTGDGFGPANPASTNATEAGKADNRRVELFKQ